MTHLVFSSFHDFPLNARPFILDQEPDGFDFDEKGGSNHLAFWFDDYEYSAEDVAVFLQSAVGEFGLSVLSPIVEALRAPEEHGGDKIEEAVASDGFWKHLQSLIGLAGFYTYQSCTRFIIFETAAFERQGLDGEIDNWREYPLTLAVVDREGGIVGRVDTLKFFEAQKAQVQSNLARPVIADDNEVVHLPAYCVYEVDENDAVVTVIVQGANEEATEHKLTEIVEHWIGYEDHRFIGAIDANAAAQLKRIGLSHIYE